MPTAAPALAAPRPGSPATSAVGTVPAIPSEPARPAPAQFAAAPITLQPDAGRTACPCPPPFPPVPAGQPVLFRLDGALLRTVEDDVVTLPKDTVLARLETGRGPAYCTGYTHFPAMAAGQDAVSGTRPDTPVAAGRAMDKEPVTRSGRDVCLYDRNGDNFLDAFAIPGSADLRFYETGPFPFEPVGS